MQSQLYREDFSLLQLAQALTLSDSCPHTRFVTLILYRFTPWLAGLSELKPNVFKPILYYEDANMKGPLAHFHSYPAPERPSSSPTHA